MSKGLIHVYTGDGKGKTTAAFGLAIRAAGHGKRVLVLQFLKSRIKNSGEVKLARKSGVKVIKFRDQTSPIFDPSVSLPDLKKSINEAVTLSLDIIKSGKYDLIILEEFNNLFNNKYVKIQVLQKIIDSKPDDLELVFTGRGAPQEMIDIADYVTEMRMIKHPAGNGVPARKGIEY